MPPHPWARSPTIRQAAGLGLAVVGLDQATKLAATLAAVGQTSGLVVPVHNPHFSLGLAGAPLPVMALLMAAGILAAGGYSLHAAHRRRLPAWVPGLLVGGAGSNLLDRLVFGAVRDFLATPWAVINLADLAVLAAVTGSILAHLARRPPAGPILGKEVHHDPAPPLGHQRHAAGQLPRRPHRRDRPPHQVTSRPHRSALITSGIGSGDVALVRPGARLASSAWPEPASPRGESMSHAPTPWIGLAALAAMFIIPFLPTWLFEGPRTIRHRPRRHICGDCQAPWTTDHTCIPAIDAAYPPPLHGELRRRARAAELQRWQERRPPRQQTNRLA